MQQTPTAATCKLFIGMDIHKKSLSVHFRTDLFDHRGFTMPPEPQKLCQYVSTHFPDHEVSITYEAGCCGFSAARFFESINWKVTVVNAGDVPRVNKRNYQKTDSIDCRNLCKQLSAGQLRAIYVIPEEQEQLRSLVRHRAHITKLLRVEKLQIKGMLLYMGITIPERFDNPNWSKDFLEWLRLLDWKYSPAANNMQSKLRILQLLHEEYLSAGNELRRYCRTHHKKDYYLLKSIPGIGGFLAAAILGELGDIRRFSNEEQFSSYIGMVPGMRNSGGTEQTTGITPRGKSLMRSYLIEAVWVAIRKDPEMQTYYRKHFGKNVKNIIVKVAHKLVRRILSVIKTEQPYIISQQRILKTATAS